MMHFPWGDWASSDFSETVVADGDGGKVYKLAFILIGRSSQNYFLKKSSLHRWCLI
jgi:hypothetical protein